MGIAHEGVRDKGGSLSSQDDILESEEKTPLGTQKPEETLATKEKAQSSTARSKSSQKPGKTISDYFDTQSSTTRSKASQKTHQTRAVLIAKQKKGAEMSQK